MNDYLCNTMATSFAFCIKAPKQQSNHTDFVCGTQYCQNKTFDKPGNDLIIASGK